MSNMKPDAKANISMVFNEKNIKTSKLGKLNIIIKN